MEASIRDIWHLQQDTKGGHRTMSDLMGKLQAKLQLLQLMQNKSEGIVDKGKVDKIGCHKEALEIIATVEELKRDVEQAKVGKWGKEIENQIDEADVQVDSLQCCLKEAALHSENDKRNEEEKLLARQCDAQLEQKMVTSSKSTERAQVKMPKLVITKFDGKFTNWLAFWNKFEAVTKFTYLKEIVQPNMLKTLSRGTVERPVKL